MRPIVNIAINHENVTDQAIANNREGKFAVYGIKTVVSLENFIFESEAAFLPLGVHLLVNPAEITCHTMWRIAGHLPGNSDGLSIML